ncbi:MAG: hypothetical protein HZB70_04145 [Candidatus Berkelbacteria bacterium]|nr:MAG: hypothetical protein HZB70_04145 [Candidatus Berkelbacteria bacterium]QQG51510.1 MAG: hypothetical protein HY845_03045 [Candidatus Berkelbacteria bacterium]
MVTISDEDRQTDAAYAEELFREDAMLVRRINAGESQSLLDKDRDAIERKIMALANKYQTGHLGVELISVIKQEPLPVFVE